VASVTLATLAVGVPSAQAADPADVGVTVNAPSAASTGSVFQFTATVINHGPAVASNVSVVDYLPGSLTLQSVTSTDGTDTCGFSATAANCSLGSMTADESTVLTFTVERTSEAGFTNSVQVSSDADPYSGNNHDYFTMFPDVDPSDLAISMTGPITPPVGSTFDVTITVVNNGPATASSVLVTDNLPSQVSFVAVTPSICGYSSGPRRVSCYTPSLANGASIAITLSLQRVAGEAFSNTASVSGDNELDASNNSASWGFAADPDYQADVGIDLTAPSNPPVGTDFDYTVTLTNHGPAASSGSRFYLNLPGATTLVSGPAACVYEAIYHYLNCSTGAIPSGDARAFTVTVHRDGGYPLSASASLSQTALDPNNDNNFDSLTLAGDPSWASDVEVDLSAPASPVTGTFFEVTMTVENHGPYEAADVDATLYWDPDRVTLDDIAVSADATCEPSIRWAECFIRTLDLGEQVEIVFTFTRTSPNYLYFDAESSSRFDLVSSNNYLRLQIAPDATAETDMGIVVEGPSSTPPVGASFDYTITVSNHGSNLGRDVQVTDVLPDEVTFISASPASCTHKPVDREVSCPLAEVPSGDTRIVTLTVRRDSGVAFTNTANVSSLIDFNEENDSDQATVAVDAGAGADMSVSITGPGSNPAVGSTFSYALTLTNGGPGTATNVHLTSPVPTQTSFVSVLPRACWYKNSTRNVRCDYASIPNGGSRQVTITLRRNTEAPFTLSGSAASDVDPNSANNTASVQVDGGSATLTVTLAGSGAGSVSSSPAGISCPGDCAEAYPTGTVVDLTATPTGGSTFTGWSGACTGVGACQVTMNVATSVTATFASSGPTVLFPTSFTVQVGSAQGGDAASLAADDDNFLVVGSTTKGTRTATWYGTFTGVSNATSSLAATYKGKSTLTCTQVISMWRWTDSTWVQLDSRSVGTTEVQVSSLTPPGSLADFVSGTTGTGDVRLRVSCSTTAGTFSLSGDLMRLNV
jgi:uncharacterized repeat protein (TIGR01451 family)